MIQGASIGPKLLRIRSVRKSSKNLVFLEVDHIVPPQPGSAAPLVLPQVLCSVSAMADTSPLDEEETRAVLAGLRRYDVVLLDAVEGTNAKGQRVWRARSVDLVSPCLAALQPARDAKAHEVDSVTLRHRTWLLRPAAVALQRARSSGVTAWRRLLTDLSFAELATPILWPSVSGAAASPFATTPTRGSHHELFLRIAPELFLKRALAGGLASRVFEIGPSFRDEGADATHAPEFHTLEAYAMLATASDMQALTEDLCASFVGAALPCLRDLPIDEATATALQQPFASVRYVDSLRDALRRRVPECLPPADKDDLSWLSDVAVLRSLATQARLPEVLEGEPRDAGTIVDRLFGALVEPSLVAPTFVTHQPLFMSPLAAACPHDDRLADRFELFVRGREIANGYTELVDPVEQERRFAGQSTAPAAAEVDERVEPVEAAFLDALDVGLAPTGGLGVGVERILQAVTGAPHIRDVIPFPLPPAHRPPTQQVNDKSCDEDVYE